jgi:hypothetical protein
MQMQLGLVQNDPTTRAPAAAIEGAAQQVTQARGRSGVARGRPRLRHELTGDDLGDEVLRNREQILVGRAALDGSSHALNV